MPFDCSPRFNDSPAIRRHVEGRLMLPSARNVGDSSAKSSAVKWTIDSGKKF